MGDDAAHDLESLAAAMVDGAAAGAPHSPSPSPSSSGASSPRTKRRCTDRYALGFEFAPRLAPYEVVAPPRAGPSWTESSTFALLDAWGDRFVRAGRSGLRADEWLEVARVASAAAGRPPGYYSETHCRNRIDTLRKKFKKERERVRLAARRSIPAPRGPLKWVYYDKMVSILYPLPPPPPPPSLLPAFVKRRRDTQPSRRLRWGAKAPECLLGGGGDAGPRVSGPGAELVEGEHKVSGLGTESAEGEPRVSGLAAELVEGEPKVSRPSAAFVEGEPKVSGLGAELVELEPQKISAVQGNRNGFLAVTESIQKFGEVFARIESSKRRHMAEVEQMRKDLQRDLDAKWREILEKAQAEIACLSDVDGDEDDVEEDGDGGDDKRLEDGGGQEQSNGVMDASP
ncbi:hypothetical protein HU200_046251 [Digitaria exilis]|uniref:Myb/SANT-like DNA-binding domain-containing protein n=1 Tax=Digitaria exilis TaxID=1010633 RepID=A0A835EEZ5_9POAL|nr:hypothetical protein HU200_046251 [Digitaria exilis]